MDKMKSKPSCNLVNLVDKKEGFSFPRRTRSVTKKTKPLCNFVNSVDKVVFFFALLVFLLPFSTSSFAQEFTARSIGDFGNVAVMDVTGNYDAKNPDGSVNSIPRQVIAKEFFKTHKDEYDFLVIFSNFNFQMLETQSRAFYHHIKNDVQGIGQQLFDYSSFFGSNGRLQGSIDMGNISNLVTDPLDPKFEETFYIMAHEQMHRWGAYVKFKEPNGNISEALLGRDKNHWSFLLDSKASVLYGNQWQDNGNGTFTSIDKGKYYSPLDLYLMGLYDRTQVPPMLLIENPDIDPSRLSETGVTINGTARYISIDDIIATEGTRIPGPSGAQRTFKTAFIFITLPGTFIVDTLYGVEELRGGWLTRFSILTDGRAIVDVASTPKEDIPTNPGITPPTVTPRALPPNIDDGVRWLMNNQRSDGSWMDLPQTKERDTAETVYVLKDFDFAQTNYSSGLLWLNGIYSGNMDYLSRKIETFVRSGQDVAALMNELLSRQNPDGGWGSNKYYLSNPTDTSFALKSLAVTGYQGQTVLAKAIEYLKLKQNADGGWGNDDEGSSIQVTANVLLSFKGYRTAYPLEEQITGGMTWLIQRQNLDGGFGNSPSTIYDTAVALLTLKELGASNEIVNPGLNYILSLQSDDGSWYRSPYQTALAVKAVWKVTIDPDLSIKANDITITPSSITSLPLDIVITTIAQNLGRTDVAQVKVVLYDGAVSDANKVGEQVLAIPGQSSVTVTFSLTIRDGNEHLFYIVIDPENLVKESDKTNNTAAKALHSETTYDFEILSSDISVSPNPVDMLHDVRINSKIRNKGTMNAYNVQVRYYIDEAGGPYDIATSTLNIPANSTITNEITWKASKAGQNLPLTVLVDPFNSFDEISKANNKAVTYLSVNALTDPNLSVSYQDILITPSPANERGSVNISALIKNEGFSQASNILVNFYRGVPGQDGVLLGSQTIPSLNAGESIRVSIDWTNIMESGERIIYVQVDPLSQISEVREDDNSAFTTLKILSLPDFAISTNSITFNPPAPKDGDIVAINVTVQNKGEQGASNLLVRASDGSTVIGSQIIPSISGNSQAVATITYNTTGKSGPHQITVVVDPDNTILEQSKDNNQASRTFGVQNANLWLTELYISPNGDGIKDSTQFFFRLNNPQTVKIVVVNEKGDIVRSFSGAEFQNTTGGNVTWDGKNDNGVVVADGDYQIKVVDANNNNLGSLLVVVDNNRSPLVKAIGTKYLLNTNPMCMLTNVDFWQWFPDESAILVNVYNYDPNLNSSIYPSGLYTVSPDGEDILRIVPWDWKEQISGRDYSFYTRNPRLPADGDKIAFVLYQIQRDYMYGILQAWVVNRDGGNLIQLDNMPQFERINSQDFRINGLSVLSWSPNKNTSSIAYIITRWIFDSQYRSTGLTKYNIEFWTIKPDGTDKLKIGTADGNDHHYLREVQWSPDGGKIAYVHSTMDINRKRFMKLGLLHPSGGDNEDLLTLPVASDYTYNGSLIWIDDQRIIWRYEGRVWLINITSHENQEIVSSNIREFIFSPDKSRFAFVEYGDDKWYVKISDNSGQTDVLHEAQYYPSSFEYYQIPSKLQWSNDGSKLAFVDYTYEKLDDCHCSAHIIVMDIKTGEKKAFKVDEAGYLCLNGEYDIGSNHTYRMDYLQWFPDDSFLLVKDDYGLSVVLLESGEKMPLYMQGDFKGVSPQNKYIMYTSQSQSPSGTCYSNVWAISSLLNLTADLRIRKEKSAIVLKGSAVDLNFEGYVLEYADAKSPTVWNLVTPASNVSVIDDVFTTWVPPYEGIFYVRLTVWDKAGNVAWDRKRVSWGLSASITNLYKTLEYFSPNGDGVKDTVELRYKVLEPVHLEFNIYDENNNLKRTFLKDHANPGEDFITWDGRDENGGVVPDGKYKIKVFDYEFFVKVDNTPPDVNIVLGDLYPDDSIISVNLTGHAVDQYIEYWVIEYGEGDNPQEWYEYLRGEDILVARDDEGNPILNPVGDKLVKKFLWTDITWLVGKKLRITAEDFAGNRTTAITEFLEEEIVLNKWDMNFIWGFIPDDLAKPGQHNLAGLETIRLPVVSLNVQYMKKVGEWIDSLPIIDSPSASFNVEWDNSSLGPEEGFSVRLRAVDILGQEHYSNILGRDRFEVNSYCKAPNLIAFNILHEELKLLSFQMKESGGSAWADYWVLDSSKGDSIPTGTFYPPIPSVQPGSQYLIRMIGIGVSGKTYESIADYPPLCLQLYVVPDEADCGYMSNKAKLEAKIDVKKMPNLEGISFKALSYYIQKPEGLQLLRQFDLTIEKWGNVEIDTLNMPEGSYPVEAILSYVDSIENTNVETTGSDHLVVDRILPNAQITYPGTSLRICPIRVSDPKGDWYGIPVEGMAADNTQVKKYALYWGIGENPSGWMEAYTRKMGERKLISGSTPVTGNIATWDITGLKGETYSLMIKVMDVSGNVSCQRTSFSFDQVVEITYLATDKTLFSPNGNDILDDVIINYGIDEYARVDVKVFKLLKNQDGTYSLDSTPVRTIVSGQQHLGGTETTSWDGKDDAGTVVPDGLYGIAVFATDSCGNTNMRWIGLEVDNTPPTTAITYPQPSDPLGNIVEVKGTADDLHFQSYTLEVGQGDYPETWNLISSSTNPVENGIFGQWNTFGREGKWTLRLTATDTVGNKNTTSVTIDLGQRKTLIKDLAGNPRLFSPNNDGKLDTTGINYEVTDACDMTIEIIDFNSTVRKTYTTTTSSAGVYSYTWDGRDNAGALVPDGTYAVKLTAALSSNTSVTQTESVTVVVDSTPPFMDIKQPLNNSYLKADVIVNGAIGDANIREYSVAYTGDSGAGTIDQGNQNRVNYTFGFINELAEGNYTLAVKAKDLAENSVEQNIAFVIDRTPPKVSLDAPKEGEYYGSDKNTISVTGAIVEKNLDTYSVRYGSGDNPTQWTDLLTGNVVPTNPQLITWKVGKNDGIPDGLYTVSLFAKDKAGLTGEAKVKVTVDNTPPEAVITSPAEGGYVRAAIDINGTAFDQNLEKYIFEISEGQCSSAYKWVPIKTSTTSVRGGVIASWHTLPPDGDCCLRVTVSDKVGNKSEARVNVKVDTQPPAAPVLTGKVENKSSARLTWTANSEPDLSGYNLYRDAKKVNTALIKDINYLDQNLKEGTYTYTVTAIDLAGNESKPSNQIKLTVDITPPDARINSPQGSAWVSGLVDIKGTAYSADDFKEYRVSIGQGSAPSAWNLIRTSPLATSYGSLAPWDTIGLPEGIYSIKLEAEDLSGNINTHQVAVNLDNTPPRAPVLLTATATGSDVTLTWQANPEADLAGYLLYRNDQLANVSGIVIGNLKPYLIVGTTYLNKAVPDGKSRYYLIAMDQAGNLSDQSNTLEVDIDTRPPHATIAEPLDKSKIQDKTFVRAESPDTDIASVQFQYKRAQDTTWINLNNPVADSPYGTYLDPAGLGFVHGDYHLRAVATDLGSKTDPSPSFITVTYTDLASPDTPKDLRALTNGTDVTLTWTANTETDLDGYNIYRTSGDSKTKINSAVVKATTYPDNGLADASYTYEVTAIDTFSNESKPSNSASARVYAPLIQQPYTPTGQNVLEIRGSNSTATASVEVTIEPVSGSVIRVTTPSDPAGNFNINNASLALGENRITAKATDSSGNISRVSEMVVVVYNEPPSAPTGLNASVNGNDVALTWNSNTETDLSGYNLYRDGKKLNLSISIAPQEGTTSSSDMDSSPADAFDLDPETYWYSSGSGAPVWWQIDLSTPELINHMEIHWASGFDSQGNEIIYGGKEYEIQVWSGYAWITQAKVTGNNTKDNTFDFKPSYRTDKIRIYVTESADPSVEKWVSISEVGIVKDVLITQPSYADSGTNVKGEIHTFKATAVDYYGFESAPSEEATAEFGDSISPAPPQNLTTTVTGPDILLAWSPNSETDLAGYNIYRNASQGWLKINTVLVTGVAYIDPNVPNGTYTYRVTAVDSVGNESLPSNEATATVEDFIAPSKPEIFYPTSYGIPITLFKDKADISGTAEPGSTVSLFRNGTSAASMTALASDGMESFNFNIELWGSVSPDGKLFAYENYPSLYLQILATGDRKQIAEGYYPQWSPNGGKLSYVFNDNNGNSRIGIYDVVKGSSASFNGGTETSNEVDSSWSYDGNKIAYLSDRGGTSDAWLLDLSSGLITQVTSGLNLNTLRLSPDGRRLAYSVDPNLYVIDIVNGTTIQADTNADTWYFEWAPDSRMLVFTSYRNGNADIFVLDTETQAQTQITNSGDDELYPFWSPDGRNVVYQKIDQSGNNSIEIASSQTAGQQRLLKENLSSLYYLSWLRSGKIAYIDQNILNVMTLKGSFSFQDVSLNPGENIFYATATDASGNMSPPSDEIFVLFDASLIPDLEITPDDIFIYPVSPVVGEEVAVTVIYRNKSQLEVTGVDVNIYLWDSKGNVELLKTQTIGRLAPASEEWITLSLDTTGKTGSNRIIAVIDPEDKITEALEDNNDAIKEFFVAGQEGLFMTTTLDATQYQSKQDVNIMVNLKNSGAEKAVTLEVWVEDENGVTVASVNTIPADLPYASEKDYSVVWNTGLTFSGAYRVHTILKEGAIIRAENTVPFSILPDTNIQTTVVTDKAGYRPNENVVVTITVRNGGENAPISELKTITRILDAGGQELFKEEDAIKNLLPGGISSLNFSSTVALE